MAKTTAPLLSFGAGGQIGKSMVYGSWRGIKYSRRYVVPSNPNTIAQQTTRSTFAYLREAWKLAPAPVRDAWDAFAQGRPFTGMNKFVGENIRTLRGKPDLADIIFSPGAKGGMPLAAFSATTGSSPGEIDVSATAPIALPQGWTMKSVEFVAIKDGDPATFFSSIWTVDSVSAPGPYTATLTGLDPGVDYAVGAFAIQERPDGSDAYSVSYTDIAAADA